MRLVALTLLATVSLVACDQLVTNPSRYAVVEAHTTRRDGTPVPYVPLVLSTGQRIMAYDTTDANGFARFERVPEGPAYGVYAGLPSGYERLQRLLGGPPLDFVDFTLKRDSVPVARFQFLKVGPGTVVAKVVEQTSAPISGVDVELYSASGVVGKQKTITDGTVQFGSVPFGTYGVRAVRPNEYRDLDEPLTLAQDGLLIEEGATATGTLTLARCLGTITLRVSDSARGAASGVRTELFRATGVVETKRTDSNGTVAFTGLLCGDYGVRILRSADWLVMSGRGLDFTDGLLMHRGTTRDVTLPVQYNNCRGTVRASVVDASGITVPGAVVTLFSAFDDPQITRTTTSGAVTFDALGCGPERGVRVTPPPGWSATPGRGGSFVDGLVVTNNGTVDARFTLSRTAQ